mgnify:CR=1 FL=1
MARNNSRHLGLGIILILVGVIFLLRNLDIVRIYNWWPIILLLIGVAFFVGWMRDRQQSGMLLPAGIFLVLGVQFLFLHASWPIYLLAPAAGFWLMYFLGERDVGLLVPASVLTVIALVFWLEDSFLAEWWPALLIILGVILLIFPRRAPKTEPSGNQSVHEQKGETEL